MTDTKSIEKDEENEYDRYWERRKYHLYYKYVKSRLEKISIDGPREWGSGPNELASIVDIGCADTPIATFGRFSRRLTIDKKDRPSLPGVIKIIGTLEEISESVETMTPHPECDVVTCLQVIEHIENPRNFIQLLFKITKEVLIISVPWMWEKGKTKSHIHDPIDYKKMEDITGACPNIYAVIRELNGVERAVFEYWSDKFRVIL